MEGTERAWRVLDLTTDLAGAYATRLLAWTGAAVTRVDPPGGHPLRRWSASGAVVGTAGPLFAWLAGGQEAVTVDPASTDDLAALRAWLPSFDVILWSPGAVLETEAVAAAAPASTVVAVTPFGLDGPWASRAATEFTLQALSGGPALRGSRAWPPMSVGGRHGDYMIGVFAAVAALLARRRAQAGGAGGVVDLSGLEAVAMTQLFNPITMATQVDGVRARRPPATVADVVRSKDGYVGFAVVNRVQHWIDFCLMIGRDDWADDVELHNVAARTARCDELNPVIAAWAGERTTAAIVELAALWRIPCIEVGNGETIPAMDHIAAWGFHVPHPVTGVVQPAAPFRLHPPAPGVGVTAPEPPIGAPIRTRPRPSPPPARAPSAGTGGPSPRPCEGLRVADLTSFWAGPFLTHTLALFGADVVHVESTGRPDGSRLMNHHPRTTPQWWERSPFFHGTNTNKRGVTVDLRRDEGRELARGLVATCDVLVENYSPRVLEGFGLSWDEVHALNPGLVMVRMPAFGLSGPWRDRTGFAMTMEQVSGMAWLSGFPEHDPGALFGPCDPSAGLHALVGLLAALEHRRRTGEGVLVEAPMVAGALNVAGEQVIEYSAHGVRLDREGNRGPAAAPQNCYATADAPDELGAPRWVALAVAGDDQWRALRDALGDPAWARDPALATHAGRRANHDALDTALGTWCAARTGDEIVGVLAAAGVPAAPVVLPTEQLAMEQLVHRGFFEDVDHPVHGRSTHVTYPFRLPGDAGPVHRRPAPLLGQHNDEVFGAVPGVTAAHLAALEADGVIGRSLDD